MTIKKTATSFMALMGYLTIAGIISFRGMTLAAEEESGRWFFADVGLWGGYYGGSSEDYYLMKGTADAIFQFSMIEAVAGYTRYQHYQVTDGNGNYGYADVNHLKAAVTVTPGEMLEITAGYRYYIGTRSYNAHLANGGISVLLDSVTIGATFQWKMEKYEFMRSDFENYYIDAAASVGYDISDRTGVEAEFTHGREDFEGSILYYSNLLRLGFYHYPLEKFLVGAGITGGADSADYAIFGAELSLGWIPLEGLTISLYGFYNYYAYQGKESTTKTKVTRSTRVNPRTDPSLEGESFGSWGFSLGATYRI